LTNPDAPPSVALPLDVVALIERLLVEHRSLPGARCATCGKLPEGMTPTRHRATLVYNRLEQAGLIDHGEPRG
jgi:hypothetical protein